MSEPIEDDTNSLKDSEVPNDDELPPTLQLWFCIGCGSMGHFAGCDDGCRMEAIEVVSAEAFADLLECRDVFRARRNDLAPVVAMLQAPIRDTNDAERRWHQIRDAASAQLASLKNSGDQVTVSVPELQPFSEVHRCAKCGASESYQPCIGVCVRKTGEFVERHYYEAIAAEVLELGTYAEAATALLRQICRVAARKGQWLANLDHFRMASTRIVPVTDIPAALQVATVADVRNADSW